MPPPIRDRFLKACRREPTDATPVWFMRQAGRYLPEYRKTRGRRDVLKMARDPETVVEITLQPLRRFDADAAILFSDIMVPLAAAGVDVRIERGVGPVVGDPFRSEADLRRLRPYDPAEQAPYVAEAVRLLVEELRVPLIGFAGGPFTLASYLVEGGPSRDQRRTKALMHEEPETFGRLLKALTDIVIAHLRAQVEAGAHAVQVFDSWAGALERPDYADHVHHHSMRIFAALDELDVPLIHFGVGTSHILDLMAFPDLVDVVGVDWRLPIDMAWNQIGLDRAIQGNLDPAVLTGSWETVQRKARDVLGGAGGKPGHIFNLGHGVLPETPPDTLAMLVDLVHAETGR